MYFIYFQYRKKTKNKKQNHIFLTEIHEFNSSFFFFQDMKSILCLKN